ncbi:MAG: galactose mutarotase [Steroidobacteraceae bacterium]
MAQSSTDIGRLIHLDDPRAQSAAVIAPERGAIVTSFAVGGRELLFMDASTLHDRSKNVRGGVPVLFPTPGKLEHDSWRFGQRSGAMKQHGFARSEAWAVTTQGTQSVTLLLKSDATTLAQYPWPFSAELRIELRGTCLRFDTRVSNAGGEAMPYALGFHPYFQVQDKARARIPSRATRAFDNVTKTIVPFTGFDLTQPEVDIHLLDHPQPEATLQLADGAYITVRGSSDVVRWVVWTLAERDFVCVEPWTAPGNALNTGEHLIVLAPGATHTSHMEIEYGTHG